MAITWTAVWSDPRTGEVEERATLYTAQGSADNGEWFSGDGIESMMIEATITSATMSVDGSNAATVPSDATDGLPIVADVTSSGYTSLEQHQIPKWIKIHAEAVTTSLTVEVKRRRRIAGV